MPAYKGKIVEVHRNFNMHALAQNDPEVKAWYGQAYRNIGPYFKHKAPASGLTFDEEKILMPVVIRVEPTDKDFRRSVTDFYHNFGTKVPQDGLKLQVSLQNDALPLSADNLPQNINDYLSYKHMLEHNDVALDKACAEREYNKKFYILDPDGVTKDAIQINELEDKATVLYMRFKEDTIKLDQILTMLGVNITKMNPDAKVLKFKELSKKDDKFNETEQREAFERFINTAEDKDLEYRYLIQEMIGAQYLKRVGTALHYNESGDVIGQDMDATVMYFKNPKNSRELNLMRAEYMLKLKKGEEYLPKEAKVPVADKKTV